MPSHSALSRYGFSGTGKTFHYSTRGEYSFARAYFSELGAQPTSVTSNLYQTSTRLNLFDDFPLQRPLLVQSPAIQLPLGLIHPSNLFFSPFNLPLTERFSIVRDFHTFCNLMKDHSQNKGEKQMYSQLAQNLMPLLNNEPLITEFFQNEINPVIASNIPLPPEILHKQQAFTSFLSSFQKFPQESLDKLALASNFDLKQGVSSQLYHTQTAQKYKQDFEILLIATPALHKSMPNPFPSLSKNKNKNKNENKNSGVKYMQTIYINIFFTTLLLYFAFNERIIAQTDFLRGRVKPTLKGLKNPYQGLKKI